jgi:hypothetical protein
MTSYAAARWQLTPCASTVPTLQVHTCRQASQQLMGQLTRCASTVQHHLVSHERALHDSIKHIMSLQRPASHVVVTPLTWWWQHPAAHARRRRLLAGSDATPHAPGFPVTLLRHISLAELASAAAIRQRRAQGRQQRHATPYVPKFPCALHHHGGPAELASAAARSARQTAPDRRMLVRQRRYAITPSALC